MQILRTHMALALQQAVTALRKQEAEISPNFKSPARMEIEKAFTAIIGEEPIVIVDKINVNSTPDVIEWSR